jgi:hypothetical protein
MNERGVFRFGLERCLYGGTALHGGRETREGGGDSIRFVIAMCFLVLPSCFFLKEFQCKVLARASQLSRLGRTMYAIMLAWHLFLLVRFDLKKSCDSVHPLTPRCDTQGRVDKDKKEVFLKLAEKYPGDWRRVSKEMIARFGATHSNRFWYGLHCA